MRINTNIASMSAIRALGNTSKALARALERLATGKRINSASDDAAGLAIGTGLESQRRGMLQAVRNVNDAQGFLNTAEGAIAEQTNILQRMRELAMKSANGTLGSADRLYLDKELQQLFTEYQRLTNQTNFNGANLLDGSFATSYLQVGAQANERISFSVESTAAEGLMQRTVGTGSFTTQTTVSGNATISATTGDINNDGHLDLIVNGNFGSTNIMVRLGNGDGTFSTGTTITGSQAVAPQLADLNADGNLDFICKLNTGNVEVRLGTGRGTFGSASALSVGTTDSFDRRSIAVGDINGDGRADLAVSDSGDSTVSLLLGTGSGTFGARTTISMGGSCASPILVDLNKDGYLDIATVDDTPRNISIRLGNGDGTFGGRKTYSSGNGYTITAGDVTGDGVLDLVTSDFSDNAISVYRGMGNGTFAPRTTYSMGTTVYDAQLADLDSDGDLDVAATARDDSAISIRLNNGNGSFASRSTLATTASAYGLELADFNEDDVPDLVSLPAGTAATVLLGKTLTRFASSDISVATQSKAADLLEMVDDALDGLASRRANIGAVSNRLDRTFMMSTVTAENLSQARSQIMDADVAQETAELTRQQILQSAGVSVLGQANVQMQTVLTLLGGIR